MHCYIIDLDGTIYRGNNALPYAGAFISRLNTEGSKYVFFTNSPEKDPLSIEQLLRSLSISIPDGRVITSGTLAIEYLASRIPAQRPLRVNILGSQFLKSQAESQGMLVTGDKPDYVLVAFADDISIREIKDACLQISAGASFIATNPDDVIPYDKGLLPHTGTIIQAITRATGAAPFIIGKPSPYLTEYFTRLFNSPAEEICVVGDRLDTDMQFARNCGFKAYLVLTGITSHGRASACRKSFDRCFKNLKELALDNKQEREYKT